MVRGNKFKPKPAAQPNAEANAASSAEAAGAAPPQALAAPVTNGHAPAELNQQQQQPGKKRKKERQKGGQHGQEAAPAPGSGGREDKGAGKSVGQGGQRSGKPVAKKQKLVGGRGAAAAPTKPEPAVPAIPTTVVPAPPKAGATAGVGSNWAALKSAMAAQQQQGKKPGGGPRPWKQGKQRGGKGREGEGGEEDAVQDAKPSKLPHSLGTDAGLTKILAVDCEMVGVGPEGIRSALARVCIVNSSGNVVLDTYVRPKEPVTDYRTKFSGVRPSHLAGAPDFDTVQKRVGDVLRGRVVVGHALTNDLKVLLLGHPRKDIRDTSRYPPLMRKQGRNGKARPRALRVLAEEQLGLSIQAGEHNPVDDARAALYLYLKLRKEWEKWLAQRGGRSSKGGQQQRGQQQQQQPAGASLLPPHPARPTCAKLDAAALAQLARKDYMADL